MHLEGAAAFVTGGASGIGRGFAKAILGRGGKVAIVDIDEESGNEFASELSREYPANRFIFLKCDVKQKECLKDALKKAKQYFGHLDIICNNAGVPEVGGSEHILGVNLFSVIWGTEEGAKYLCKSKGGNGGVIINTASMSGVIPATFAPHYTASKFGVVGYTRAMKYAYKEEGIRINCVCPVYVKTNMLKNVFKLGGPKFEKKVSRIGIVSIDMVVEGFIRALEDETLSGSVICVLAGKGVTVIDYSDPASFKIIKSKI